MVHPYARERAYLDNARQLGLRWRTYAGLLGAIALVVVVVIVFPMLPLRLLFLGFVLGGSAMLIALGVARFDDPQVRGYLAEEWSVEGLKKVKGWLVTDNLPFDRIDVDHVVVTPSGVLAVETKFHGRIQPGVAAANRHSADLQAAQAAATKIRSFLRSKKLHDITTVTPVLIVWGPGRPDLPHGHRLDGDVHLVDGDHPELWSTRFNAPLLPPAWRRQIHECLADYQAKRHKHQNANEEPLRGRMWSAMRAGIAEERESRSVRAEYAQSLQRRHGHARG